MALSPNASASVLEGEFISNSAAEGAAERVKIGASGVETPDVNAAFMSELKAPTP
jgi:hypothetical protein